MTRRIPHATTKPVRDMVLGVFAQPLQQNKFVEKHFNSTKTLLNPPDKSACEIDLVVGWGRKPRALKASDYASKNNIPFTTLEDGFIHSMSQGRLGTGSWSMVVDEFGIFYDANTPSTLERLINTANLSLEQRSRANRCIDKITKFSITKYNNARLIIPKQIQNLKNTVLVIDQVDGDMSIPFSFASNNSFNEMLEAAINENPNSDILVKVHPDVINGKRKGCITLPSKLPPRVHICSDNVNPLRLFKYINKVYAVSSQAGFEALLMNKPVVCFGAPFYAGWGLTDDRLPTTLDVFKRRSNRPDLATLFYVAYVQYSHYIQPDTQNTCELEQILDYVKLQYGIRKKYVGKLYCIGFSPWKKKFIRSFLKSPDNDIFFAKNAVHAKRLGFDNTSKVCLWSSKYLQEANTLKLEFDTDIWKIEDGFLRSITLGSNYAIPASLVVDKTGLYFDPQHPSDLEEILLKISLSKKQHQDAEKLKNQLIDQAVSKYNVGIRDVKGLFLAAGARKKILIPGQVSDDESILKGCVDINSNLGLIEAVRRKNPDAYIAYKPHPDVLSGNRKGQIDTYILTNYCDEVILDVSITDCLDHVDEVHTMTSLVGFEALIRGLEVHCYGVPFYSNWGLTTDIHKCERRTRELSLNELISGALISYPLYMNWDTQNFTTAEIISNKIYAGLVKSQKDGTTQSALPPTSWRWAKKKMQLLRTMLFLAMK